MARAPGMARLVLLRRDTRVGSEIFSGVSGSFVSFSGGSWSGCSGLIGTDGAIAGQCDSCGLGSQPGAFTLVPVDVCERVTVDLAFKLNVRPYVGACHACHDMTATTLQRAPGPKWYHPTDDGAIVDQLASRGLIDADEPANSKFLLRPLALDDGGIKHPGGKWFAKKDQAYSDFITFLTAAKPCVNGTAR